MSVPPPPPPPADGGNSQVPVPPPSGGNAGGPPPPPQVPASYPQGGVPASQTNKKAMWSLITSLAGLVCCGFILGIVAIVLGVSARKEIKQTGQSGDGMALAGIIIGAFAILSGVIVGIYYASHPELFNGN